MNWDQVEGKWKQMKGSAKEQWGKLTNDDLDVIAGHRDKLIGKLQERYGYAKEEAERRADEWFKMNHEPEFAHSGAPKSQSGSQMGNQGTQGSKTGSQQGTGSNPGSQQGSGSQHNKR